MEARVKALRGAGDDAALLAAARDAADEIERHPDAPDSDRTEALKVAQRLTFNAAADCWPGWSVSDRPIDPDRLLTARELAERSLRLVERLELGPMRVATGIWLVGAFDLALGRYDEASRLFGDARGQYGAANAPGLVLLVDGYAAIVRQIGNRPASGDDLDQICARIAAGGFKDGDEWIAQLRTALEVFAR
ncbi:hypothetical protein QMZ05_18865 [Bradyrhizobium sp. INPA03-11B]|uniref:hypothetical protein n=1 Tax=Bradyrhizobium sp. INPA03-11B TaxID=418598 RepID=UPI00338DB74A